MIKNVLMPMIIFGLSYAGLPVWALTDDPLDSQSLQTASQDLTRSSLNTSFSIDATMTATLPQEIEYMALEQPVESSLFKFNLQQIDESKHSGPIMDGGADSASSQLGARVTDVGVALAHSFTLALKDFASDLKFGLIPKFQRLTTYSYRFDNNQIMDTYIEQNELNSEMGINFDASAKLQVDRWRFGVGASNLVSRDLEIRLSQGGYRTYNLQPQLNVISQYDIKQMSLVAQVDLLDQSGFDGEAMPRYGHIGVEFEALETIELHMGINHDLNDLNDSRWMTDVSFEPAENVVVNIAGEYSEQEVLGGKFEVFYRF